ncbi:MAG TPA: diguanylate cyclase, partial [Chthonomonadaceae bacterium]|nr:diguanylate cyclase [Chthonomonadaceae bacterium]
LRNSELTYATMVNSIADGVIATDAEGRVCFLNSMAEKLTGRRIAEMQGLPLEDVFQAGQEPGREGAEGLVIQALHRNCAVELAEPYLWMSRQGETFPVEGSVAPVADAMGRVVGAVVIFREITERKRLESQIARHVERLHERSACLEVQQAELMLQREELLLANKKLVTTNERLAVAVQSLEALATTDGLTGLKNHRAFHEQLAEESLRAQRYGAPLSLILLDVDRFKQFNDTFGHPAGDIALKHVAEILKACARQTDTTARYGGEEFAIILTGTDSAGAMRVAERMRTAIEGAAWEQRPLTASLGISTYGARTASAEAMLLAADQALYHSKLTGRNRITHLAEMPLSVIGDLHGNLVTPYSDLVHEMMCIQTDMLTSASEQVREVMSQAYDATVVSWSRLLDLKDKETEGHSARVTEMTERLGRRVGMNSEELLYARWGALLHDVGKMGVPDHILHKPGPLTQAEWRIMQSHTIIAYELLAPVTFLRPALDIPYSHHEKWDGTGYPQGLRGDSIPLAARLFAVVDVYDALTNDRPYCKAWTPEQALAHLRSLQGSHFDPRAVRVFLDEFAPS